jgi:DNA-binding NarL/FixJ family response regulator
MTVPVFRQHLETENGSPIRLLIADQHTLLRHGLQKIFESCPDMVVVGQAADGEQAMQLVKDLLPDVLLLDLAMDKVKDFQILRHLRCTPQVRTIVLTAEICAKETFTVFGLGAGAVLLKKSSFQELQDCIRSIHAGRNWTEPEWSGEFIERGVAHSDHSPQGLRTKLTARQLDVVAGVVTGYTNKEIATRLCLSEQTVKHHLRTIFTKTAVSSRLELAMRMRDNNFAGRLQSQNSVSDESSIQVQPRVTVRDKKVTYA